MEAKDFVDSLIKYGFSEFVGVPCSYLSPLIKCIESYEKIKYSNVVNEGIALAVSLGNHIAGKKTVILMQNSGLGNIFNLYTSYVKPCCVASLFIISYRKNVENNQEQHDFMGNKFYELLRLMEFMIIPATDCNDDFKFLEIKKYVESGVNVAVIVEEKETFNFMLQKNNIKYIKKGDISRKNVFEYLKQRNDDAYYFVGLGYNSRDFYHFFGEKENVLYVTGAMGYVSAIALGFAKNKEKKSIIIDSDGAFLMHMENLSTIGQEKLKNLVHIVFDNNCYNTTGEQQTISRGIDFCCIAKSCGYDDAFEVFSFEEFKQIYDSYINMEGTFFLRVYTNSENTISNDRPDISIKKCCNQLKNYCLEE